MDILDQLMAMLAPEEDVIEAMDSLSNQPTLVYRIEDETGFGPYRTERDIRSHKKRLTKLRLGKRLQESHGGSPQHPAIGGFVAYLNQWDDDGYPLARVGMKRLKDLRNWFDGFIDDLNKAGYTIALYKVEQWTTYKGQVVFNPTLAERVESFPICTLK